MRDISKALGCLCCSLSWKEFDGLEAEMVDLTLVLDGFNKGLRLNSLFVFWFWTDYRRPDAEILDSFQFEETDSG